MFEIREYRESDWARIWPILQEVVRAGDTYTFSPQSTEQEIRSAWIEVPARTLVAATRMGEYWEPTSSRRTSLAWAHTCAIAATL